MAKETFQPSIKQLEATNKVYAIRRTTRDPELAKLLNLSKVTMYTRLKQSNWSDMEIIFIEYKSNNELAKLINSLNILENNYETNTSSR